MNAVEADVHSHLQLHYLEDPGPDFVRRAVDTALDIHRDGMPGDILLLLPGMQLPWTLLS